MGRREKAKCCESSPCCGDSSCGGWGINTCWAFCQWLASVQAWLNFHSCGQDTAVNSDLSLLIEASSKPSVPKRGNVSVAWNSCSANNLQVRYEDGVTAVDQHHLSISYYFLTLNRPWTHWEAAGSFCGVHCFTLSHTTGCTNHSCLL